MSDEGLVVIRDQATLVVIENEPELIVVDEGPAFAAIFQGIGTSGMVPDPGAGTTTRVLQANAGWVEQTGGGGGGAPTDAQYIVSALNGSLSAERVLGGESGVVGVDFATAGQANLSLVAGGVVNAKLANMAQATIKGRASGAGTGVPVDLTAAQTRTVLNVADGANNYSHPNHSGDVTSVGDGAQTIVADVVTNAKLANVSTATIKGRATAGTGDPEDLTPTQARTVLNVADGANAYVHPNHSGDVTSVADGAQTIAANAVTYAKMQDISATDKLLGRATAGAGDPEEIPCTSFARSILDDADAATVRATIGAGTGSGTITDVTGTAPIASSGGATPTISLNDGGVTLAKMANLAQNQFIGRITASTGVPETATITAAGRALIDDADAVAQRTTLGLGALATKSTIATADIDADAVDNTKLRNSAAISVIGRSTNSAGDPGDIAATLDSNHVLKENHGVLEFGKISGSYLSPASLTSTEMADGAITYAKMQDISATDRLLGRDTAGAGDPEELTVGGGLEFTGAGGIQRSALTGDATSSAGSGATKVVQASESFALLGDITPGQITSQKNDYNPTNLATSSVLRLKATGSQNITGIQGGADGRILVLQNCDTGTITLNSENSASSAANRFSFSADLDLNQNECCVLQYDSTASRWRCIAAARAYATKEYIDTAIAPFLILDSGVVTLVAGVATASTAYIDADGSTRDVLITLRVAGGTLGAAWQADPADFTEGASFIIRSVTTTGAASVLDTSTVCWTVVARKS